MLRNVRQAKTIQILICSNFDEKIYISKYIVYTEINNEFFRNFFSSISRQKCIFRCELHSPESFIPNLFDQRFLLPDFEHWAALNIPRRQKTQLIRDMYIFEESVSIHEEKIRKKSLEWKYKTLVIESWPEQFLVLEFTPHNCKLNRPWWLMVKYFPGAIHIQMSTHRMNVLF